MKKLILIILLAVGMISAIQAQTIPAKGFAVMEPGFKFQPYEFSRHSVGDNEIQIEIMYAAICHSDLHEVKEDWYKGHFPIVPGHETIGRVVKIGKDVTKFKVGDYAGVGPSVNSCGQCGHCLHNHDNYCAKMVSAYNSVDYYHNDEITQGGYSNVTVVPQDFAFTIPKDADLKRIAPLLCAGVTAYVPIHKLVRMKQGDKVGVAGFGGIGHLAVKYAIELGAEVTVFDITEEKRSYALQMGAVKYVNVNNPKELKGMEDTFDLVISTIPVNYDLSTYLSMVAYDGNLCVLGVPATKDMPSLELTPLMWNGTKKVFASMDGSVEEIQETLNYSVAHNIYPDVEIINADVDTISKAFQNVKDGKVKFRYVIDMSTMK